MSALIDLVPAILWDGDPATWQFRFVSRAAEDLLGYPVGRWTDDPDFWALHIHPDDREWVLAFCANKTASGAPHTFEYRMIAADGRVVWIRDSVQVEMNEGKPTRFYGVMVDVTDRRAAEEALRALTQDLDRLVEQRTAELRAVNQELEAFSYSVSHDLRAPLRAIEGFLDTFLEGYGGAVDPRGRQMLERARAAGGRMRRLVDDLLAFARAGQAELRRQEIDLGAIAREVAATLQASAPERLVEWVFAPDLVAQGDPGLLRVVMENVLGNAWKFSSRHATARVEVGADRRGPVPVYFVRDDGAGFDMSHAANLFEPFQRLHAGSEFEGTGVGLATVRRIAERHGGRVWAEAEVEKGATVYFTLAPV